MKFSIVIAHDKSMLGLCHSPALSFEASLSPETIAQLKARRYERYKKSALAVGTSTIFAIVILGVLALL